MRYDMHIFDKAESTNALVKEALARGEAEGWTAQAYEQSAGCGRQGRIWQSPRGGLYLSILLRPQVAAEELPSLSLAAAIAVSRAAAALGAQTAQIKWPNDVVLGVDEHGRIKKLAGILAEACRGGICLGIGLNVVRFAHTPAINAAPLTADHAKNTAAYAQEPECKTDGHVEVDRARDLVLAAFLDVYDQWQSAGFASLAPAYRSRSFLDGRAVTIADASGTIIAQGSAAGIDDAGRLLLTTDTGEIALCSNEAHLILE